MASVHARLDDQETQIRSGLDTDLGVLTSPGLPRPLSLC